MSKIAETIKGLRTLADWLEEKRDELLEADVFFGSLSLPLLPGEHTQAALETLGTLLPNPRQKADSDSYRLVTHRFSSNVDACAMAAKSDICTRRQVGTRRVEAYDEPVYEWDCEPLNILGS